MRLTCYKCEVLGSLIWKLQNWHYGLKRRSTEIRMHSGKAFWEILPGRDSVRGLEGRGGWPWRRRVVSQRRFARYGRGRRQRRRKQRGIGAVAEEEFRRRKSCRRWCWWMHSVARCRRTLRDFRASRSLRCCSLRRRLQVLVRVLSFSCSPFIRILCDFIENHRVLHSVESKNGSLIPCTMMSTIISVISSPRNGLDGGDLWGGDSFYRTPCTVHQNRVRVLWWLASNRRYVWVRKNTWFFFSFFFLCCVPWDQSWEPQHFLPYRFSSTRWWCNDVLNGNLVWGRLL